MRRALYTTAVLVLVVAASAQAVDIAWSGYTWKTLSETAAVVNGDNSITISYTGVAEYPAWPRSGIYQVVGEDVWEITQGPWFQVSVIEPSVVNDGEKDRAAAWRLGMENSAYAGAKYAWVQFKGTEMSKTNEDTVDTEETTVLGTRIPDTVHTMKVGWRPDAKNVDMWWDGALVDTFTEPTYIPLGDPLYVYLMTHADGISKSATYMDWSQGFGYVPEPMTMSLLGIGALAMLLKRRR